MINNLFEFSFFLSRFINDSVNRRMHLYKKNFNNKQTIYSSEYLYPILMCSDIFLLNINKIIVGKDQLQHLELYNYTYSKLPEEIRSFSSKVEPVVSDCIIGINGEKMSKSYKNTISFFDKKEEIKKNVNKIQTKNISKEEKIKDGIFLDICCCIQNKKFKKEIKEKIKKKVGFKILKETLEEYILSEKKVLEDKFLDKEILKKQLKKNISLINKRNKNLFSVIKSKLF